MSHPTFFSMFETHWYAELILVRRLEFVILSTSVPVEAFSNILLSDGSKAADA